MITIHYDAVQGVAIPDGMVADYVTDLIALHAEGLDIGKGVLRTLSSGTVIDEFRLRILRGELSHLDLQFVFEDRVLVCNEYANIKEWPKGFCDLMDHQVSEILRLVVVKHRQEKDKQ